MDIAIGNLLGVASGQTPSFGRTAKFVAYDMPKYLLYDAVLGGFAEGMGIREPRPLLAPWQEPEQPKPDEIPVGITFFIVSRLASLLLICSAG
jgi:hypothetical protein